MEPTFEETMELAQKVLDVATIVDDADYDDDNWDVKDAYIDIEEKMRRVRTPSAWPGHPPVGTPLPLDGSFRSPRGMTATPKPRTHLRGGGSSSKPKKLNNPFNPGTARHAEEERRIARIEKAAGKVPATPKAPTNVTRKAPAKKAPVKKTPASTPKLKAGHEIDSQPRFGSTRKVYELNPAASTGKRHIGEVFPSGDSEWTGKYNDRNTGRKEKVTGSSPEDAANKLIDALAKSRESKPLTT